MRAVLLSIVFQFSFLNTASPTYKPQLDLNRKIEEGIFGNRVLFVSKFGNNHDVDANSDPEDVNDSGGDYMGFPIESETLAIVSNSSNDSSGGSGARTLRIYYCDTTKNCRDENSSDDGWRFEDVTLNGTSPVTTTNVVHRVWRAKVLTSGSTNTNQGSITISHSSTSENVFSVIQPETGQTKITAFTIPLGYVGYLEWFNISMRDSGSNRAAVSLIEKIENGTILEKNQFGISTEHSTTGRLYGMKFNEKSDIMWRAKVVSNSNADIGVSYRLRLVKIHQP